MNNSFIMDKSKLNLLAVLVVLLVISCEQKKDNSSNFERAKAFEKISNKNESLKSKEKRIENYKSAISKSKNFKKSLEKNYTYSGYGSSESNNPNNSSNVLKNKMNESKTNVSNRKVTFKSSNKSTAIFSAYSTN